MMIIAHFAGQCIEACPVGALKEKDSTQEAWEKIKRSRNLCNSTNCASS